MLPINAHGAAVGFLFHARTNRFAVNIGRADLGARNNQLQSPPNQINRFLNFAAIVFEASIC